ncbi:hypothetical protein CBS101457_005668 [Exobasidium rhododendri]|nr:hypothetical protein CBS101457_005668 [Exobasidium rhododendri]
MDVVAHYSPPSTLLSSIHASSFQSAQRQGRLDREARHKSLSGGDGGGDQHSSLDKTPTSVGTDVTVQQLNHGATDRAKSHQQQQQNAPTSTTFNRAVEISLMEPVGSMSISPANRDVVLAARKGLFILDLENPYDQPRFLPHLTTWVPADVQWNPHPARASWVASTSNNKLLVWNLDRPAAHRIDPIFSVPVVSGSATGSSATSLMNAGTSSTTNVTGTLPHVPGYYETVSPSVSQSSSISHVLDAHTRAITDINWSPFHPEILASCGIDTWMWAWDLREPSRPIQGYSAWNAAMTQVKWNRASPHRLATSCDNKVLIWDDRKGALPLATIEAAQSRIYGIDWSRDTSSGLSNLVTCSLDGSVKWWNLDSPAAQAAIGERRLVTEAEAMIQTKTPVWRARHLPFGNGVMTLPQRGDTSLGMWAKDKPDEPVHRFEGHRDIVKEYLIRTQGGSNRDDDDRKFQLITWSKDQTLRLWPISEDMMKAVGHHRHSPIRVLQTRINSPNVTYRSAPVASNSAVDSNLLPGMLLKSPTSSEKASIQPPSGATRSLLSGSTRASLSGSERMNLLGGSGTSPLANLVSPSSDRRIIFSSSLGNDPNIFESHSDKRDESRTNTNMLAVSMEKRHNLHAGGEEVRSSLHSRRSGKMSLKPPMSSSRPHHHPGLPLDQARREKQKRQQDALNKSAAAKNYMTRGAGAQSGQSRLNIGSNIPKGGTGRGGALDAVGWIAGVRMGEEEKENFASPTEGQKGRKGQVGTASEAKEDESNLGDSAQIIGEEIKAVSKNVVGASFEKIDVSTRSCTATCYGPWAGKSVACFLRITFTFPPTYPYKVPKFELEHNASVSLKTRAFLLRKVSSLLVEATLKRPPEPSMQSCLRFLLGETLEDDSVGTTGLDSFWLPGDESDEEVEQPVPILQMPPRLCGASFGPNGLLVVFRPSKRTTVPTLDRPSAALAAEFKNSMYGGTQEDSVSLGSKRFLQSYTALSSAMGSLARMAKEGMSVQDLDVVQLMADQNFFIKRIHHDPHLPSQHQKNDSKANSSIRRGRGESRGGSLALQDRLDYIQLSRPSSKSRAGGRKARSASPMPRLNRPAGPGVVMPPDGAAAPSNRRVMTEAQSHVFIWNASSLFKETPFPTATPPFLRRRSSSMPSSPSLLSPRSERTIKLSSLAVPAGLQHLDSDDEEQEGQEETMRRRRNAFPPASAASPWVPSTSSSDSSDTHGSDSQDNYGDSDSDEEPTAESLLLESQRNGMNPVIDQILDTIIWTMPFGFLFLMMDIMIQQQYAMHPSFVHEAGRLATTMPILTIFVYATAIRPNNNRTTIQLLMFIISTVCGCSFLYIYAQSAFLLVTRRVPPLGTLWLYSLVRLDLPGVLLSLALVWAFTVVYKLPILS